MNTTDSYAVPELLAETDWLAANLSNPDVRIIDARSEDKYDAGHIAEAINLTNAPWDVESTDPAGFAEILSSHGISDQHVVVCYDDLGPPAARLWWVLFYYGLTSARFLNGGITKWMQEGRAITSEKPNFPQTSFEIKVMPNLLCSLDYAKAGDDNPNTVFWDTRLEGEYLGEISRGNAPDRVGHIPGAVHLEWNTLVESDSQTIKPANEVQAILEAHGMTPDKEIFTY